MSYAVIQSPVFAQVSLSRETAIELLPHIGDADLADQISDMLSETDFDRLDFRATACEVNEIEDALGRWQLKGGA